MKKICVLCLLAFLLIGCDTKEEGNLSQGHSREVLDLTIAHQEEKDVLLEKIEDLSLKLEEAKDSEGILLEEIENLKSKATENPEPFDQVENVPSMDSEILIVSGNKNDYAFVMVEPTVAYAQRTYILGSGEFLDQMAGQNKRQVLHLGEGSEVASFHIYGTVYNFQWAMVTWDENITEYTKDPPKHLISSISDTTVYIHTTLPEGLPYEVVGMENESGDAYDFLLSYDGYGLNGEVTRIQD